MLNVTMSHEASEIATQIGISNSRYYMELKFKRRLKSSPHVPSNMAGPFMLMLAKLKSGITSQLYH